ncbi:hypothetical protein Tco_0124319 [Tanacetum coccineum]
MTFWVIIDDSFHEPLASSSASVRLIDFPNSKAKPGLGTMLSCRKYSRTASSLCIMSQSIPEQLNVDRREFADAVNALTEFVFLKYQLKCSGAGIFSSAIVSVKV